MEKQSKASQIYENTLEDFNDEFITGLVYTVGNNALKPLREALLKNDNSILDEALGSAINSFAFQTMNAVIQSTSQYATAKLIISSSFIYAYIKTNLIGKVMGKMGFDKKGKIVRMGKAGSAVTKGIANIITGSQNERLAIANMANNNVNNLTNIIAQERQTQVMMQSSRIKSLNDTVSNHKNVADGRYIQLQTLFNSKMKAGNWEVTENDKKIYQAATGFDFRKNPQVWNKTFVDKLNSASELAKDSEGNMINEAQAFLDYITTVGFSKAK